MIAGLSGPLLSHDLVSRLLDAPDDGCGAFGDDPGARRRMRACYAAARERLGPASTPRQIFDLLAAPLLGTLGFSPVPISSGADLVVAELRGDAEPAAVLVVTAWGDAAGQAWRHAVHYALAHRCRWAVGMSGPALRLFDAGRAYARRYAAFDLELTLEDERAARVLGGLLRPAAFRAGTHGSSIEDVVSQCERHRIDVGTSLRHGVHDALVRLIGAFRTASRRQASARILDESLIVVYRMLFLLFAEARSLVPLWHPVYRDGYTIRALQESLDRRIVHPGIWEALQAMARLAHRGCRAGALRVPAFNGRLFSPADAPLADTLPLDDEAVGGAIRALTIRRGRQGPERISYEDLGVEQLGSVYEHLLDFDLTAAAPGDPAVLAPTGRRKATGSFYTPRALTEFVVRRTLAPLVAAAASDEILQLRVLDPAMGSGAFLVAACRYLAAAYEQALVREGVRTAADIDQADRAAFRRAVAQRCLFGVDVNPMAVQLGRLSLWLATLSADRPLSFLDHHLRVGNSLIGASLHDIVCRPPPGEDGRHARRSRDLPLFAGEALQASLVPVIGTRLVITRTPDDSVGQVRQKEQWLASLERPGSPLERWRTAADLWCSLWCSEKPAAAGRLFRALLDRIVRDDPTLPSHLAEPLLTHAASAARAERFFHWTLEFPEAFHDEEGTPLTHPGFDAVIGNPPWDMLREGPGARRGRGAAAFLRRSGVYSLLGDGHGNLYQVFVERALQLVKRGGRAGLVLPAGFASDHACAALRRHMFSHTTIDTFTTLENRDGIFPIHRGLKFLLLTLAAAGTAAILPVRSGVRSTAALDTVADEGVDACAQPVSRALLERLGGDGLAVPEIAGPPDLDILSRVAATVPALEDSDGWQVRFGRELNVTDDRPAFTAGRGLPVIEGKHIQPFAVDLAACRYHIPARDAARRLRGRESFRRPRLAYREVAAATNRLTLIAAVVPAGAITCHTVFCLKTDLDEEAQQYLCGVFNSYVANYLVRTRVGTHVTAAIMARLRVPRPSPEDARYAEIVRISRRLARAPDPALLARLNALVALEYGLTSDDFRHILETFPLVAPEDRAAALQALKRAVHVH
jgi:hypothetical protein